MKKWNLIKTTTFILYPEQSTTISSTFLGELTTTPSPTQASSQSKKYLKGVLILN